MFILTQDTKDFAGSFNLLVVEEGQFIYIYTDGEEEPIVSYIITGDGLEFFESFISEDNTDDYLPMLIQNAEALEKVIQNLSEEAWL
jgi:hypothetical protein